MAERFVDDGMIPVVVVSFCNLMDDTKVRADSATP